jgi:hypothetical protein
MAPPSPRAWGMFSRPLASRTPGWSWRTREPFPGSSRPAWRPPSAGGEGRSPGRTLPPARVAPTPGGTSRDRLRRSRLYLPGNEPKFMVNAGLHGPDGVILDLEDSVHPDEKDAARFLVLHALRNVDFGGAERMVRINQGPLGLRTWTPWCLKGPT